MSLLNNLLWVIDQSCKARLSFTMSFTIILLVYHTMVDNINTYHHHHKNRTSHHSFFGVYHNNCAITAQYTAKLFHCCWSWCWSCSWSCCWTCCWTCWTCWNWQITCQGRMCGCASETTINSSWYVMIEGILIVIIWIILYLTASLRRRRPPPLACRRCTLWPTLRRSDTPICLLLFELTQSASSGVLLAKRN